MPHLQWLDISHNIIREVDFDAFKNTKKLQVSYIDGYVHSLLTYPRNMYLQVLYLSHNRLTDMPQDMFKPIYALRVMDLSYNHLRSLPDNLFYNGGMEK